MSATYTEPTAIITAQGKTSLTNQGQVWRWKVALGYNVVDLHRSIMEAEAQRNFLNDFGDRPRGLFYRVEPVGGERTAHFCRIGGFGWLLSHDW